VGIVSLRSFGSHPFEFQRNRASCHSLRAEGTALNQPMGGADASEASGCETLGSRGTKTASPNGAGLINARPPASRFWRRLTSAALSGLTNGPVPVPWGCATFVPHVASPQADLGLSLRDEAPLPMAKQLRRFQIPRVTNAERTSLARDVKNHGSSLTSPQSLTFFQRWVHQSENCPAIVSFSRTTGTRPLEHRLGARPAKCRHRWW